MIYIFIISIIISLYLIYRSDDYIIPIIIFAAIFGCGPGINGHYFLDELIIIISILFNFLLRWKKSFDKFKYELNKLKIYDFIFILFASYYFLEGIRSAVNTGEFSAIIYGGYFIYLISIYIFMKAYNFGGLGGEGKFFSFFGKRVKIDIVTLILAGVIIYNFSYIVQGIGLDLFSARTSEIPARFMNQGVTWSGTAYAVFPNLLGMIVAIKRLPKGGSGFGLFVFSILVVSIYYDSRVALGIFFLTVILGCVFAYKFIWKQTICVIIFGVLVGALISNDYTRLQKTFFDAARGTTFLVAPRVENRLDAGDYDRYAHFYVGFNVLLKGSDLGHNLFGYGLMMHRLIIGKYIIDIYLQNPKYKDLYLASKNEDRLISIKKDDVPTDGRLFLKGSPSTSFTSVIVDGGFIGAILYLSCIFWPLFLCINIFFRSEVHEKNAKSIVLLLVTALALIGWSLIIFMLDLTLYSILLMPAFLIEIFDLSRKSHHV